MNPRKIAPFVVVALLIAGAAAAIWRVSAERDAASTGPLQLSGTIEATEVMVSPRVSGRIVASAVSEGQEVTAGVLLFKLDDEPARLTYAQAKAGVRAAKAAWRQAIDDDKSDGAVASAKARYDQAVIARRMAALQIRYARITSPATGTVLSVAADAGENAAPGQTLAVIGLVDDLYVSVYVPEERVGEVSAGAKATVTVDSSSREFGGRVTFVASEAEFTPATVETKDQRTKLVYEVRVKVDDDSGTLKPGMPADVVFE